MISESSEGRVGMVDQESSRLSSHFSRSVPTSKEKFQFLKDLPHSFKTVRVERMKRLIFYIIAFILIQNDRTMAQQTLGNCENEIFWVMLDDVDFN